MQVGAAGVAAGSVLITSRLIIGEAGPSAFAFVTLVASITGLLPFLDLGTGAAVTNSVATLHKPGGSEELRRVVRTSSRVLLASAATLLIMALLFYRLEFWRPLLGNEGEQPAHLGISASLALTAFALSIPWSNARRVLLGFGRNELAIATRGVAAPANLAITATMLWVSTPIGLLAAAPALSQLIATLTTMGVAYRVTRIKLIRPLGELLRPGKFLGQSLRATSIPMLIVMIGLPVGMYSDRIILTHATGTPELASYSLGAQIYSPLWAIAGASGMALWPIFAGKRVAEGSQILFVLRRSLAWSLAGGIVAAGTLMLSMSAIARLVAGDSVQIDPLLSAGFALLILTQIVHLPSAMLLTDARGLRVQALTVLAMMLVNVPLSWFLALQVGAPGPVYGSMVAIAVCQWVPTFTVAMMTATKLRTSNYDASMVRDG